MRLVFMCIVCGIGMLYLLYQAVDYANHLSGFG